MCASNISLVKNNAKVGAEIASAIADITGASGVRKETVQSSLLPQAKGKTRRSPRPRIVCVGGSVIDTIAKSYSESNSIIGTSTPGKIFISDGGVGRNVVEVLGRLGTQPLFYTAIGNEDGGIEVIRRLETECGVITTEKSVYSADGANTAQYIALLDHAGELIGGIADMHALTKIPIPSAEDLAGVDFLVLDANAPVERIVEAAQNAMSAGVKEVFFEPTSVIKAQQACERDEFLKCVSYAFPNEHELLAMADAATNGTHPVQQEEISPDDEFRLIKIAATTLLLKMREDSAHVVATLGSR